MRPLAIVRPEPGASATAKAARELGIETVVAPLFAVRPLEWKPPPLTEFDALLFTSANAVRHGGDGLKSLQGLSAHCVGEATASAARGAGFRVDSVGKRGIEALLRSLAPGLRLLHLCGAHRRDPAGARQPVARLPVYEAVELPLPAELARIEGAVAAVHSPRAGSALARAVSEAGLRRERIAIAAISDAAGEAAGPDWLSVAVAGEPSDAALLSLAAELCKKPC